MPLFRAEADVADAIAFRVVGNSGATIAEANFWQRIKVDRDKPFHRPGPPSKGAPGAAVVNADRKTTATKAAPKVPPKGTARNPG